MPKSLSEGRKKLCLGNSKLYIRKNILEERDLCSLKFATHISETFYLFQLLSYKIEIKPSVPHLSCFEDKLHLFENVKL